MKRGEDKSIDQRLIRLRADKMAQDFKDTHSMSTEAQCANSLIAFKPDIAPKPMTGKMEPLPKWHR
jgi:hypothetical protein